MPSYYAFTSLCSACYAHIAGWALLCCSQRCVVSPSSSASRSGSACSLAALCAVLQAFFCLKRLLARGMVCVKVVQSMTENGAACLGQCIVPSPPTISLCQLDTA